MLFGLESHSLNCVALLFYSKFELSLHFSDKIIIEEDFLLELLDSDCLQEVSHGTLLLILGLFSPLFGLRQLTVAKHLIEHPLSSVRVKLFIMVVRSIFLFSFQVHSLGIDLVSRFHLIIADISLAIITIGSILQEEVSLTL